MNDPVFVSSLGMIISLSGIMVIGAAGGLILYVCEKVASKKRPEHH
jgi:hypothetical protein